MEQILHIETATTVCSVGLAKGHDLIAFRTIHDEGYSHGEKLHVLAGEVLEEAGLDWSELNAIAVSIGPGSYTGLRIGVASVKGWCYALGLPMIAISTLEGMAHGVLQTCSTLSDAFIVPMIDARRMEVYTGVYNYLGKEIIAPHPLVVERDSFIELMNDKPVIFCGDGATKCIPLIQHPNAHFVQVYPDSRWLVNLAVEKMRTGDFSDLAYTEPMYLKGANITVPKSEL